MEGTITKINEENGSAMYEMVWHPDMGPFFKEHGIIFMPRDFIPDDNKNLLDAFDGINIGDLVIVDSFVECEELKPFRDQYSDLDLVVLGTYQAVAKSNKAHCKMEVLVLQKQI